MRLRDAGLTLFCIVTLRCLLLRLPLLALLLALSACGNSDTNTVKKLVRHVRTRSKMILDTNGTEMVWSDGAILEVGTNFPAQLQEIISQPTAHTEIHPFIEQFDSGNAPGWKDASTSPSPRRRGCSVVRSSDGTVSAVVQSVYVEYLHQRYPAMKIRVKSDQDPVLFVVDGQIRSAVMPMRFD